VGERIWSDVLRARAETALRESEERLRMALEAGRMGTWRFDLATGRQQWSEQQFRLFGLQPDAQPPTREFFLSLVHPGDLPLIEYSPEDLEPGRGLLDAEFRIVRPDGEVRWLVSHTTVRRNAEGEPIEMIGLNWDVTDRKQADMALRETEERLRQFGEASSDVLWIRNAENLQWEYLTSAFETIYGEDRDAALKGNNLRNWVDMILPEDREHALDNIRRVRQGQRVTFEYRITRPSDGQVRWLRNTDFPLWDAAGNVQRIGGIGHDSTLEKEAVDRQQVLMAELQHRTRNLIAVVQSLADKTVKESTSLGDFRERYRDRLKAVARVQGLLSRLDDGHRITFDRLLETELSALGVLDASDRVTLIGPRGIALRSGTVQTFALALHELATNAVKYGALAAPAGRLKVRWGVVPGEPGRLLTVEWRESGVVMPNADTPPQGSGYGRELIERALPYQLKATTSYQLGSDGVCCTIAVPVSEAVEPEETSDV
jgi:PAS domain S-box-containing protein